MPQPQRGLLPHVLEELREHDRHQNATLPDRKITLTSSVTHLYQQGVSLHRIARLCRLPFSRVVALTHHFEPLPPQARQLPEPARGGSHPLEFISYETWRAIIVAREGEDDNE